MFYLLYFFMSVSLIIPSLVQDVAQKMNEIAGDGTTTATVSVRTIYSEGIKNVGRSPMDLR